MNNKEREEFLLGYNRVQKEVHQVAKDHGWWDDPKTPLECVCLMHSELSEAAEAVRDAKYSLDDGLTELKACEKKGLENITNLEEELADVVIRIMDYCGWNEFNLATTILKKMEYNKSRPYKHGRNL